MCLSVLNFEFTRVFINFFRVKISILLEFIFSGLAFHVIFIEIFTARNVFLALKPCLIILQA